MIIKKDFIKLPKQTVAGFSYIYMIHTHVYTLQCVINYMQDTHRLQKCVHYVHIEYPSHPPLPLLQQYSKVYSRNKKYSYKSFNKNPQLKV